MNGWKILCGAEAAALLLALWWLRPDPDSESLQRQDAGPPAAAPVASPDAPAPDPARMLRGESVPAPEPASSAKAPHPPAPRSDGRVCLIGSVVDENGAPIIQPWVQIHNENGDSEQITLGPGQSTFLLVDRLPGDYELEIQATGYAAMRGPVRLRASPGLQRQTFRLERAWRVLVRVETEAGERLVDWLARSTSGTSREFRPLFAVLINPPTSDLAARDYPPFRSELGVFVAHDQAAGIPAGWDGALDVASEPPLHAAAWLGSLLLGSAPLRAGEDRLTIVVNEQVLATRLSIVTLQAVDAISRAPLPLAKVALTPQWMGSSGKPVDDAGRIRFEHQIPGRMDLEIFCAGYGSTYRDLTLRPGETLDLGEIGLSRTGAIRGRVLDPQGNPCPRFPIMIFPTGAWQSPEDPQRAHSFTDDAGLISLQASTERHQLILGGGPYGLQAAVWERGSAETEEREIRLTPGVGVRLLWRLPENQARLLWLMDSAGLLLAPSFQSRYGDWNLSLAPGAYLLRVEDLDRNLIGTLDLRVPEGGGDLEVALP